MASDSLSGSWRRLGTFSEKGDRFQRTEALQRIREIQTYRVTEVGIALGIIGGAAGWCLGGVIGGGDCF